MKIEYSVWLMQGPTDYQRCAVHQRNFKTYEEAEEFCLNWEAYKEERGQPPYGILEINKRYVYNY